MTFAFSQPPYHPKREKVLALSIVDDASAYFGDEVSKQLDSKLNDAG